MSHVRPVVGVGLEPYVTIRRHERTSHRIRHDLIRVGLHPDEDLFLYVTDGTGTMRDATGNETALGQYDVILARPDAEQAMLVSSTDAPLRFMSFYLLPFMD